MWPKFWKKEEELTPIDMADWMDCANELKQLQESYKQLAGANLGFAMEIKLLRKNNELLKAALKAHGEEAAKGV